MANNTMTVMAMAAAINGMNTLDEVQNFVNDTANELAVIDGNNAYIGAITGKPNNDSKALAVIFHKLASLFAATGKAAGVSTIYNVLDARKVRGMKFNRKLAVCLRSSKYLANFAALTANVNRNDEAKLCISVNGNMFLRNRNTYAVSRIDNKGNEKAINKPQAQKAMTAIRQGKAQSIMARPQGKQATKLAQIVGRLLAPNTQLALPMATEA